MYTLHHMRLHFPSFTVEAEGGGPALRQASLRLPCRPHGSPTSRSARSACAASSVQSAGAEAAIRELGELAKTSKYEIEDPWRLPAEARTCFSC